MRTNARSGFSLVELLCVMTIIGILAGLMLGPISKAFGKAKRFKWEQEHSALMNDFQERLTAYFSKADNYPSFTREALYEGGIINTRLFEFLKDKRVRYFPFSSKEPDDFMILLVVVDRKTTSYLTKGNLKPPKD